MKNQIMISLILIMFSLPLAAIPVEGEDVLVEVVTPNGGEDASGSSYVVQINFDFLGAVFVGHMQMHVWWGELVHLEDETLVKNINDCVYSEPVVCTFQWDTHGVGDGSLYKIEGRLLVKFTPNGPWITVATDKSDDYFWVDNENTCVGDNVMPGDSPNEIYTSNDPEPPAQADARDYDPGDSVDYVRFWAFEESNPGTLIPIGVDYDPWPYPGGIHYSRISDLKDWDDGFYKIRADIVDTEDNTVYAYSDFWFEVDME